MKQKLFKLIILIIAFSSITYSQSVSSDAIEYVSPETLNVTNLNASYNKLQTFANYIYHKYKVDSLSSTSAVISTTDQYPEGVWGRGFYTKLIENLEFVGDNGKYNVLFNGYSDDKGKFRIVTPCLSYSSKAVLFHIYAYKSNKNTTCLGKIKAGLEFLLKNQQPNGGFIQYWWRTDKTTLTPHITENYVTSYATGDVLRALYEGYDFIKVYDSANDSLLKKLYVGVKRAADYLKSLQCSEGNNNYTSFSIWGLASAYKLTGDKSYLNRAIRKYYGIKNNQEPDGSWYIFTKNKDSIIVKNFHDTHPCYMGIILRGMAELYSAIPSSYPDTIKIEIKKSMIKTINNFLVPGLSQNGSSPRLTTSGSNKGKIYPYLSETEYVESATGYYALNLIHGLKYILVNNVLAGNDKIYVQNFLNIITNSHIAQINTDSLFAAEGNMDDNMISIGLQLLSTGSLLPSPTLPIDLSETAIGLNPFLATSQSKIKSSPTQWSFSTLPPFPSSLSITDTIVGAVIGDFEGKGIEELIVGLNTKTGQGWHLCKYNNSTKKFDLIFPSNPDSYLRALTSWDSDGDGKSELITAIRNTRTSKDLIYKSIVNASSITTYPDTLWGANIERHVVKSITTGDFNMDGYDCMVIGFEETTTDVPPKKKTRIFKTTEPYQKPFVLADIVYESFDWEISALTAGDFNSNGYDELIFGFNSKNITYPGAAVYKSEKGNINYNFDIIYNRNPDWKIAALAAGKFGGSTNDKQKDELLFGFITRIGTPLSAVYRSIYVNGSLDDRIYGFDDTNKVYALAAGNLNNVSLSKMQYDANETGEIGTIPEEYTLSQNFPNPFNPSTIIRYSVPQASRVRIEVFNLLGEKVATLVNNQMESGSYEVNWNARNFASGMYLIRIEALSLEGNKNFVQVKKAMLVK
jgi:hypothetical protein